MFDAAVVVVVFAAGFLCGKLSGAMISLNNTVNQPTGDHVMAQPAPPDDDEADYWKKGNPSDN